MKWGVKTPRGGGLEVRQAGCWKIAVGAKRRKNWVRGHERVGGRGHGAGSTGLGDIAWEMMIIPAVRNPLCWFGVGRMRVWMGAESGRWGRKAVLGRDRGSGYWLSWAAWLMSLPSVFLKSGACFSFCSLWSADPSPECVRRKPETP